MAFDIASQICTIMNTASPIGKFHLFSCHICLSYNSGSYSRTHICQNRFAIYCTCLYRLLRHVSSWSKTPVGYFGFRFIKRRLFGFKWLQLRVVIRILCNWSVVYQILDFTQHGIMSFDVQGLFLHNTVPGLTNNSNDFSHTPPKCDPASGLNCQSTFFCNIESGVDSIHVWIEQVHVQHQRKLVLLNLFLLAIKRRKAVM